MIKISADSTGVLEIEIYKDGKEIKYFSMTGLKPNQPLELKILRDDTLGLRTQEDSED